MLAPRFAVRALLACVAAFVVIACSHGSRRPPRATGNAVVPVAVATHGAVYPTTDLSGIIAPLQNVAITSTLSEPADAVYVQEGDRVRAGQVLARLNTADLQAQLSADLATAASDRAKVEQTYDQAGLTISQNSNTVNAAQAAVRQAQQTLATDQVTLQRDAQLLRQGYLAQSQYDVAATQVKNDQQAVRAAQVTLQNDIAQVRANGTTSSGMQGAVVAAARADEQTALAQAQQVRVSISKASIVAPVDGVVVNRNLNPGEFPGTRQLFTIQQVDRVYAILNASGSQIAGIHNGDRVTIKASDLPGRQLDGTVAGVLSAVQPGSTNFVVKTVLDNARGLLKPGMVVSGNAALPAATGIVIPATAFLDTTNSSVQVVRNGTVHTVRVTMLAQDGKDAVVVGVSPGEQVVANGQLGLSDDQPVTTQQVAQR